MKQLLEDLEKIINKYSLDNESNTPDFIFAQFLLSVINAYLETMEKRDMYNQNAVE